MTECSERCFGHTSCIKDFSPFGTRPGAFGFVHSNLEAYGFDAPYQSSWAKRGGGYYGIELDFTAFQTWPFNCHRTSQDPDVQEQRAAADVKDFVFQDRLDTI